MVFFSKCKPQNCDAVDLALKHKIIFFGYHNLKAKTAYNPSHLTECLIDPSLRDDEWKEQIQPTSRTRAIRSQQTANHNLVLEVNECLADKCGVLGAIPRPDRGVMYVGRVLEFELFNSPSWAREYMAMREEKRLDTNDQEVHHIADVAQCWIVDEFKTVPYHKIPSWIISSAMGRQTLGRVRPIPQMPPPYEIMVSLMEGKSLFSQEWTDKAELIKQRLLNHCSPSIFEHLCIDLLQLEHPHITWRHIGGSGDGGVDGIGGQYDKTTHVLQCKLRGLDIKDFPEKADNIQQTLATLGSIERNSPLSGKKNTVVWDGCKIAELVEKHSAILPMALTLHIGRTRGECS